jgi:uncharacterized membrane protein YedE/YeeE
MKRRLSAFGSGFLFAIGLGLAGLLRPARIIGFVDFFGVWDPSLAFAMGGAVGLGVVLFRFVLKRPRPFFDSTFHLPARRRVTPSLVIGAAVFGVGWGLSGYCPGPAVTASVLGDGRELVVLGTMVAGIAGARFMLSRRAAV